MQNTTLERRVELIRQARELSSRNKDTINGVQRLVSDVEPDRSQKRVNFFGLKVIMAIILFAGYIFLDINTGGNFLVTSDDITKAISYNIDVDAVVETFQQQ